MIYQDGLKEQLRKILNKSNNKKSILAWSLIYSKDKMLHLPNPQKHSNYDQYIKYFKKNCDWNGYYV